MFEATSPSLAAMLIGTVASTAWGAAWYSPLPFGNTSWAHFRVARVRDSGHCLTTPCRRPSSGIDAIGGSRESRA